MDAIFRTVVRLTITRRNLLEWETAAQSEMETKRKTPVDVYLDWTPAVTLIIGGLLAAFRPHAILAASLILALWLFSKPIARWLTGRRFGGEITTDDEIPAQSAKNPALFPYIFSGRSIPHSDNVQGQITK
jgi:hypothetical protein